MIKNIVKRFVSAVIILLALSIFVFALFYIAPGNPARLIAGEKASQTVLDQVTHNLGLDKPLWQQYLLFVSHALSGNFGISYRNQMPVAGLIASRLPVTFSLVGGAVVLWLLIGIPLGVVSATHPGTWKDRLAQILSQLFISFPSFVLGMFLLYLLYFLPKRHKFTLFPPGGVQPAGEWIRAMGLAYDVAVVDFGIADGRIVSAAHACGDDGCVG